MKPTYKELEQRIAGLEKAISTAALKNVNMDILQEQHRIFESVVAQSPASILIMDENGVVGYANESMEKMVGYRPEEINEDFIISKLREDESHAGFKELKKVVRKGKTWRGELKIARKDKKIIWVRVTVFPLFDHGRIKNFVAIINDISAQKVFESLAREKESISRTLVENLPLAVCIYDHKGKFLYVNNKMEQLLQIREGSLTGKSLRDLFPATVSADVLNSVLHNFKTRLPDNADRNFQWNGKNLKIRLIRQPLFDDKGEVTSVLAIGQDITQQTRQEHLLNIQHQIDSLNYPSVSLKSSLQKAFHYLMSIDWIDSGGIYLFDDEGKTLNLVYSTGLSKEFTKMVSTYTADDLPTKAVLEAKSRYAKSTDFLSTTREYLLKEGLTLAVNIPLIYDNTVIGSLNLGSRSTDIVAPADRLIIESIASRLANLIMLVNTQTKLDRSNTELNNRLKELSINQQLLIQKSRLESLGELSAGLAHEINQPLTVISLVMENINQRIEQNQASGEYITGKLGTVNQNINKIKKLIEHVRIFSRNQDSISLERVDVNQVIHNALQMIESQLRNHQINVITDLSEDLGFTIGNPARFEQVILNLLSNSRDAIEEKDKKHLSGSLFKEIRITTCREKSRVIVRVRDSGTGIPAANLDKIFNPFFTTKADERGTGLGLSIVYGIVSEMKGEISVQTEEGEFTDISINLPHYAKKMK